ncbi:MAG TPA: diacylglycerol kinase family protein [Pyrinomonadaceae bacterium]|jgi:diacylglycerol kinase family enzyme
MDSRPRTLVIINHAASRARRAWAAIKNALEAEGVSFAAHETLHAGDATETTRAALCAGYQLIAVVGGDGTLSETAAGFFALDEQPANPLEQKKTEAVVLPAPVSADATLAILPAGTGDDFARGLAGGRAILEQWLEKLIGYYKRPERSSTRSMDVIYGSTEAGTNSFICINVVTLGIGAEVAGRVAAQSRLMRLMPGEARFTAAACGALLAWRERRVRVIVDDEPALECSSNLLAVANGIYAGGGMMFAPDARPDDGAMDVLLACDASRATILRELPRIRRGAHLSNPKVRAVRCARVSIETLISDDPLLVEADGNVRGHTPARFQIMPAAIRIISPQRHGEETMK